MHIPLNPLMFLYLFCNCLSGKRLRENLIGKKNRVFHYSFTLTSRVAYNFQELVIDNLRITFCTKHMQDCITFNYTIHKKFNNLIAYNEYR